MRTLLSLLVLLSIGCGDDATPLDSGVLDVGASDGGGEDAGGLPVPGTRVMTTNGPVDGVDGGDLLHYFGIPYVAPPLGALRFQPPQPASPWTDPLDASAFGPECPQRNRRGDLVGNEDCLQLNVWAPKAPGPHPVMVWIHGGAFIQGSAVIGLYDGAVLAEANVVVVTINYRLGALGFLAHDALVDEAGTAGNYGLLDQVAALEWVRENIAAFGGDANNVTVFGESAGGSSACSLMGMPAADGLFQRAIIQSGGGCYGAPNLNTGRNPATSVGDLVVAGTGCSGTAEAVRTCLRDADVSSLVDAQFMTGSSALGLPPLGPNIDGAVLPATGFDRIEAGEAPRRAIITGSNADEARTFVANVSVPDTRAYEMLVRTTLGAVADDVLALYPASSFASPKEAYEALVGDIAFICSALSFAETADAAGYPTYTYHFTHLLEGALASRGAVHGAELFPLFEGWGLIPTYTPGARDRELGDLMQADWTRFAATGTPSDAWTAYPTIRVLEVPLRNASEIREGRCAALQALGVVP
ncbi:MAG: carboxylesterase family protein [Myxococcota bacterium]